MCTVLVTYNPKNKVANGLMRTLSHVRGVRIDDETLLTNEEIIAIENSKKSGIHTDVLELKELIKEQICLLNTQTTLKSQLKS